MGKEWGRGAGVTSTSLKFDLFFIFVPSKIKLTNLPIIICQGPLLESEGRFCYVMAQITRATIYVINMMLTSCNYIIYSEPVSVAHLDAPSDWRPGGRGFNPRRGRQHSFVEIDHEIFSTIILSLPLIQEGQLSVSGERMCTILVNRLED